MLGKPTTPTRRLLEGLPRIAFSGSSFLLAFFLASKVREVEKEHLGNVVLTRGTCLVIFNMVICKLKESGEEGRGDVKIEKKKIRK